MNSGNIGNNRMRGNNKRFLKVKGDKTIPRSRKDVNQDRRLEKVEKSIQKIDNMIELKYFDVLQTTPPTTAGLVLCLNAIATGATQITRVGGQIHMTSLQWRLGLLSSSAILTGIGYRFIIVMDRQANGTTPTVAADPTGAGTPAVLNNLVISDALDAPYQWETSKRFKILHDERGVINPISLSGVAGTAVIPVQKLLQGKVKLNHNVKYDNTSANTLNINTNSLYSILISDVATSLSAEGGYRLYFKDL